MIFSCGEVKSALFKLWDEERDINYQLDRLEYIREKLTDIGSPGLSDMPRNPSPEMDLMADKISRVNELDKEIRQKISYHTKKLDAFHGVISMIKKPERKTVILRRYIDHESWKDICFAMYGDREDFLDKCDSYFRTLMNIQARAIKDMSYIMDDEKYIWLK